MNCKFPLRDSQPQATRANDSCTKESERTNEEKNAEERKRDFHIEIHDPTVNPNPGNRSPVIGVALWNTVSPNPSAGNNPIEEIDNFCSFCPFLAMSRPEKTMQKDGGGSPTPVSYTHLTLPTTPYV